MAHPRWLSPWKNDPKAIIRYHVINRVVDRQLVFGPREREVFRSIMRRYETFSGCRVLTYCILSNHFHLLLEVPPMPAEGLDDEEIYRRMSAIYSKAKVKALRSDVEACRQRGNHHSADQLLAGYTYRMHDLSEFMKGLTQRFSIWFNRTHERTGHLWEERFKSLIVDGGKASRAVAAYIDLNPVRAGLAVDPAGYRWSGYGEAVGATGVVRRRAREGLVRALRGHDGSSIHRPPTAAELSAEAWERGRKRGDGSSGLSGSAGKARFRDGVGKEYRRILLIGAQEVVSEDEKGRVTVVRRGMSREVVRQELEALGEASAEDMAIGQVARHRVRYFIDGTVLGSRAFVDGVFERCRERFGPKRKTGARKPRGALGRLRGEIWSLRDLQSDVP